MTNSSHCATLEDQPLGAYTTMAQIECEQCEELFFQEKQELFCSNICRCKFWRKNQRRITSLTQEPHIEDLKYVVEKVRYDANSLIHSLNRILNDYSDWEDRIVLIENRIRDTEEAIELEHKELSNIKINKNNNSNFDYDALDEIFK